MANLSNFRIALFGFNKKDIESHINNLNEINNNKINEKENEKNELLKKYNEMKQMYNEAVQSLDVCVKEKEAATSAVNVALVDLITVKTKLAVSEEREKLLSDKVDQLTADLNSLEELKVQKEVLAAEKEKIAQAWIVSAERADDIIKEAREKATKIVNEALIDGEAEKKAVELKINIEREKLVDIKREMKDLKNSFVSMLHRYSDEIDSKIEDESIDVEVKTKVDEETSSFATGVPELPSDFGKSLRPDFESELSGNVLSFSDYIDENDDSSVTIL